MKKGFQIVFFSLFSPNSVMTRETGFFHHFFGLNQERFVIAILCLACVWLYLSKQPIRHVILKQLQLDIAVADKRVFKWQASVSL